MKPTKTDIVPHLWFDKEAKEAVSFYVSLFPNSKTTGSTTISDTPSGNADILNFKVWGQDFMAINAGPMFKINQSISFYVYCGSETEIEKLYCALSEGGTVMMKLDKYPWSEKYAWIEDKFGVSWQLDIADNCCEQKILPCLLFANDKFTKVKEAATFYTSIFADSNVLMEAPYPPTPEIPDGTLLFSQFKLGDYLINAMSSNMKHEFDFNEAVSLIVYCDNQEEIDYYWEKFTAEGQEQPCGWVKDKFGVSWQIVPIEMREMMRTADKDQLARVTQAFLKMKKFNIKTLSEAYKNK